MLASDHATTMHFFQLCSLVMCTQQDFTVGMESYTQHRQATTTKIICRCVVTVDFTCEQWPHSKKYGVNHEHEAKPGKSWNIG